MEVAFDNIRQAEGITDDILPLKEKLEKELGVTLPHLSMGMSADFPVAIEEGATIIRVGTDIFGSRHPQH